VAKLKEGSPAWEKKANELARSHVGPIYGCKKCGHPVIKGYCCKGCGDTNPSHTRAEDKIFAKQYAQ
jgi:hypothetical protein